MDQNVPPRGQQQFVIKARHCQGVRFRACRLGPSHEPVREVTGHDQRGIAFAGLGTQSLPSPEPDHSARGHANAEAGKRVRQRLHSLGDASVDHVGHDVQDARRVGRQDQFGRVDSPLCKTRIVRTVRRSDRDLPAPAAPNAMEDDVLLQHCIASESDISCVVHVYAAEAELVGEYLSERAEVRPVHEAAGRNRDEFPTVLQESQGEPHEGRVEIARLDTNSAHCSTFGAPASELAVRRVQNRRVKAGRRLRGKKTSVDKQPCRFEDEVLLPQDAGESYACCVADCTAVFEGTADIRDESFVDLPNRGVQRVGPFRRRPGTHLGNSRGGEDAAPASRVEEPEFLPSPGSLEHRGHETGHACGCKKLTEARAAFRVNRDAVRDLQPFKIESI